MHDVLVRHVAVREDDFIDNAGTAKLVEFGLVDNRYAIRIEPASELGRISPPRDSGYLSRCKSDNLAPRIIAIDDVEVVKIATRSAEDYDPPSRRGRSRQLQFR
jgi:hypothetical protein